MVYNLNNRTQQTPHYMDSEYPRENEAGTSRGDVAEAPLVSVIMPSFNTARFISQAIDSVLDQDYPQTELIVIDDGSTDGTVEAIRAYGDRVQLITQQNQGSAVARNTGLAAARGELIAFLDSDDVWLPGKLLTQVEYLRRNPQVDMVYGRWKVWKPESDGSFVPPHVAVSSEEAPPAMPGIVVEGSGWLYNRLLFASLLHTITVMARRRLIEAVGTFDTALKRGQDYDYWIRASRVTEIHQIDRALACYRVHGDGCIRRWPRENYERIVVEKALARWGLEGPQGECTQASGIRRRLAQISFSFGYHQFWEGDPRLALQAFAHSATRQPSRRAAWRYLALSALKVALPWRRAHQITAPGEWNP